MSQAIRDKLNRPIQDLRVSVIDRCNFRCNYCMPKDEYAKHYQFLKTNEWLSFDEIERLVRLFVSLGVRKVRVTGGEPLLRPELPTLIERLSNIPSIEDLALTTNGSLLAGHAAALKKSGLERLTVSLDSLDARVFKTMSGEKGTLKNVLDGISAAEEAGFGSIKINVVIQRGVNDHTVMDLVEHFRGTKHVLRFIEYMDVGNCNHWQNAYVVPSKEILKEIEAHYPLRPVDAHYFGEVAERYAFSDGKGEIGFISSVSQPFCQSCTRARLSTDGKLFTCLFAGDGTDLRAPLRAGKNDEEVLEIIKTAWQKREDRYSELRSKLIAQNPHGHKVEMFQIGG